MEQRFYYSIASGSTGNCGLYMADDMLFLIDVGISYRKLCKALTQVGLTTDKLAAVFITHDHIDHIRGLAMLLKKTDIPIYATFETEQSLIEKSIAAERTIHAFDGGETLQFDNIYVETFETPHDAEGSVGYIINHGEKRFGYATDLGFVPQNILTRLRGCDTVVLESNHDPHMLAAGPYPYSLKKRVSGARGHLSNPDCAVCAADLAQNGTKTLILAHLSEKNNMPELALQQTKAALKEQTSCAVYVAPKECMSAPIMLEEESQCSLFG